MDRRDQEAVLEGDLGSALRYMRDAYMQLQLGRPERAREILKEALNLPIFLGRG